MRTRSALIMRLGLGFLALTCSAGCGHPEKPRATRVPAVAAHGMLPAAAKPHRADFIADSSAGAPRRRVRSDRGPEIAGRRFVREFAAFLDGASRPLSSASRSLARGLRETGLAASSHGAHTITRGVQVYDVRGSRASAQAELATGGATRRIVIQLQRVRGDWIATHLSLP
jgi:hypothetical protein